VLTRLLQDLVGGPAAFEPFMRHYLQTFAFKNVDSQQFRDIFCDFFKDKPASERAAADAIPVHCNALSDPVGPVTRCWSVACWACRLHWWMCTYLS
jgi:hypothetical protein